MRRTITDSKYLAHSFEQLECEGHRLHGYWCVFKTEGEDQLFLTRNGEWQKFTGDAWFPKLEDIHHFLETGELPKPKQKPETLAIWWLDQEDTTYVFSNWDSAKSLPRYIKRQLKERYGRAGRSRLWIDDSIDFHGIKGEKDYTDYEDCGGIVIKRKHLYACGAFSGKFTDVELNPLTSR